MIRSHIKVKAAFSTILMLSSLFVYGATPRTAVDAMNRDLDFIHSVFDSGYAPRSWKAQHLGWDLDASIAAAKEEVNGKQTVTLRDYHKTLRRFFNSTNDYHVGFSFHSTEKASLPFEIRSTLNADGQRRYFIVYIDRDKLSEASFPFAIGDEVVSIDGDAIDEIAQTLKEQTANGSEATDQSLAEIFITHRSAARAMDVPKGPVTIEIRPKGDEKTLARQIVWNYQPERVGNPYSMNMGIGRAQRNAILNPRMLAPQVHSFMRSTAGDDKNPYLIGGRVSYVPDLGKKIWESAEENPFHAYIYRSENGKLIGYIRIPSYVADEKEAKAFAEVITRFQETTDGLVIDEINNPGGSVFYLYALVSMLTEQPAYTPKHRMMLTQSDVQEAVELVNDLEKVTNDEEARETLGETLGGYPITYQFARFLRDYSQFIVDEWKRGHRLTEPYFLGIDKINPHPDVNYDKPILVLVNELDFSGGDFFPAILQDNRRATIMGVRTSGAGGYVRQVSYPNHLALSSFSYTASIAERVDLNPIENLGVTPDISYRLSEADLRDGYKDYANAIRAAIGELVK